MNKQEFLRQVDEKLTTLRNPKLRAARKCMRAARIYKSRMMRAKNAKL